MGSRKNTRKSSREKSIVPAAISTFVGVALASYLLSGFTTFIPLIVAPLLAGVIGAYLSPRDWKQASILTAFGQTVGFWAAASNFTVERAVAVLNAAPSYVHTDIIPAVVYNNLVQTILLGNAVVSDSRAFVWLAGVLIAAAVAGYLRYTELLDRDGIGEKLLFAVATIVLGLSLVVTLYGSTTAFRQSLSTEPQEGQYAVDYLIYSKVSWLVERGVPYYEALPQAAAGDARLLKEGAVVDGKFVAWATSPSMIRQPWNFRFIKLFAPGGPAGVFPLSALCSLLVLIGLAWGLGQRSRGAGLTAAVVALPFLIMGGGWHNIMLPDWWAALAVMGSAAALFGRTPALRYVSIALALVAVLFRETAAFWFIGVVLLTAWDWFKTRKRRELGEVVAAAAAVAVFVLAYANHLRASRGIIGLEQAASLVDVLKNQAAGPLETRFLGPTSYLLFPYGQFVVPGFILIALGCAVFLLWGILKRDGASLVCGGYVLAWIAYLLLVGTFSAYWGQMFSCFALAGLGFAVAFGDAGAQGPRRRE